MFELKNKVNTATKFGSSTRADQNTVGTFEDCYTRGILSLTRFNLSASCGGRCQTSYDLPADETSHRIYLQNMAEGRGSILNQL